MAFIDLPLPELRTYKAPNTEPADFDAFWQSTLSDLRKHPLALQCAPIDAGLALLDTFDVTFNGFGGQPIKAWLLVPRQRQGKLPCVVELIGYGGGRGFPSDWLLWATAGYAHLVMDVRGQGSSWQKGDTPDACAPNGPHYPGFMTQGVLDAQTYYYRRVFADATRAIEAACAHEAVDATRIVVTGASQGGGVCIAAAALIPNVVAAMPDVPFLCHYRRATELVDSYPYQEIVRYLATHRDQVEQVFATLAYFDGVHFARRARCPALFSVGLMDSTCPPSTVYAAYNEWPGSKEIRVYAYNGHEGGGSYHTQEKLRWLRKVLLASRA